MRTLVAIMLCALTIGCGGKAYDGAKRFPLSGKVTFDGEPVDGGTISFNPATENATDKQRPSGGVITAGEYSIPEGQGVNAGTYQVEIRWSRPTGKQFKDTQDTGEMIDETKQVVPAKYNTVTELRAEVGTGSTTFDYDLKSK
ncbi:hypothetical protein GC163_09360 [bacterium]|nr:hypothetical protein [bacterium]